MGHIGPWVHGVRALVEDDPDARSRWLDEGERQLALGCVSHNHVQLREARHRRPARDRRPRTASSATACASSAYTAQRALADERVRIVGRGLCPGALRHAASVATRWPPRCATLRDERRASRDAHLPARPRRGDRAVRRPASPRLNVACRASPARLAGRAALHRPRHQRRARLALLPRPALRGARRGRQRRVASAGSPARRCATRSSTCSRAAASARAGPMGAASVREGWQRWATMVERDRARGAARAALHRRRRPEVHRPGARHARGRPAERRPRRAAAGASRERAGARDHDGRSAGRLGRAGRRPARAIKRAARRLPFDRPAARPEALTRWPSSQRPPPRHRSPHRPAASAPPRAPRPPGRRWRGARRRPSLPWPCAPRGTPCRCRPG